MLSQAEKFVTNEGREQVWHALCIMPVMWSFHQLKPPWPSHLLTNEVLKFYKTSSEEQNFTTLGEGVLSRLLTHFLVVEDGKQMKNELAATRIAKLISKIDVKPL